MSKSVNKTLKQKGKKGRVSVQSRKVVRKNGPQRKKSNRVHKKSKSTRRVRFNTVKRSKSKGKKTKTKGKHGGGLPLNYFGVKMHKNYTKNKTSCL
tara:strand:+ start:1234 stop:1521 length:288 start_codon:yes stop_codon:yes gene_type:complete